MTAEQFIARLSRPTYVLRMANALDYPGVAKGRRLGAQRRAIAARQEIREAAIEYVRSIEATDAALAELTQLSEEGGGYH